MAEMNGKKLIEEEVFGDKVSIADLPAALKGIVEGKGSGDSMLNAAYVFEAQLEQMTTWKHQLSQQMELLRRDGVKLLERQKNLAVERQRLAAEREAMAGDRAYVQKLHAQVDEQTQRLSAEGERIARGLADLETLESQKTKWEAELEAAQRGAAAAIHEAELARQRKEEFEAAVKGADLKLAEMRELEGRRAELSVQVTAAEATLTGLREELEAVEGHRQELKQRAQTLAEREQALAEREENEAGNRQVAELARRAEEERISAGRREIAEGQAALLKEREQLGRRQREVEADAAEAEAMSRVAGEGVERDRAEAQERLAEAQAAMEKLNAARARQDVRWTAIEARAGELAAAEEALRGREQAILEREETLKISRREAEEAQGQLLAQQEALLGAERLLSQKIAAGEGELAAKLAAVEGLKQQLEEEKYALVKQRQALEKKLDLVEGELAEQFEAVAKQTRRLTDRRADLEARTAEAEREIENRVARATDGLKGQLEQARKTYEERVRILQEQMERTEAEAGAWRARESELEDQVSSARREALGLKEELARVGEELNEASRGRTQQAEMLAEQLMRFEQESADWQRKLARTVAEAGDNEELKRALAAVDGARAEVERLSGRLEEVSAGKEDAENRLQVAAARGAEMDKLAAGLVAKLGAAEREIAELKGRVADAAGGRSGEAAKDERIAALQAQVKMLEMQRDDLAGQLFELQDEMRRAGEQALLSTNVMEGEVMALRLKNEELETTNRRMGEAAKQKISHRQTRTDTDENLSEERGRLLRKAQVLRAHRRELLQAKEMLQKNSVDVSRQKDLLRNRKENLEQVKRLLEKQEMIMARKLADHNALKTVAAVGIFLILILGSVFCGVYKFVNPTYRSEATVQLAPPANLQGVELQAWLTRQMEFMRSPEVTFAAWKVLRSEGEHYSMHDVREEWVASLGQRLSMQLDGATRTLAIRYVGPNAQGVSQVCNALATAYVTPGSREAGDARGAGAGAVILARANRSDSPVEDNRFTLSLSLAAAALFVSLILVIVFRHYVARQLREIDQMADEADLADLKGELA